MAKEKNIYLKLFLSTFYLSAFTFGGGYVIVPLMKKKFVEDLKWIDEKEMLDLVAIGQSAPGLIAVNTSILVGYQVAGVKGAMCSISGTVLPPLITITIVSFFYNILKENVFVNSALQGMQSGVAAVICYAVYKMAKDVLKEKRIEPLIIMIIAFVSAYFFKVNVALVIIIASLYGVVKR